MAVGVHFPQELVAAIGTSADHDEVEALRHRVPHLQPVLLRRAVIEQAKGKLMFGYGLQAHSAFALLRQCSQNVNIKLHTIAVALVHAYDGREPSGATDPVLVHWLRKQLGLVSANRADRDSRSRSADGTDRSAALTRPPGLLKAPCALAAEPFLSSAQAGPLRLSESTMSGLRVIRLKGVLNRQSGPGLEAFLLRIFDRGDRDLLLDCGAVAKADLDGVGCLLTVVARIRRLGGTVRISVEGRGPVSLNPAVAMALLRPPEPTTVPAGKRLMGHSK